MISRRIKQNSKQTRGYHQGNRGPNAILLVMAWTSRTPALDLRVLEISGSDALGFLQGQLTNDVASLAPIDKAGGAGSHHLTGYCSPKGRLFFVVGFFEEPQTPSGCCCPASGPNSQSSA
jgi:hypothetical protein